MKKRYELIKITLNSQRTDFSHLKSRRHFFPSADLCFLRIVHAFLQHRMWRMLYFLSLQGFEPVWCNPHYIFLASEPNLLINRWMDKGHMIYLGHNCRAVLLPALGISLRCQSKNERDCLAISKISHQALKHQFKIINISKYFYFNWKHQCHGIVLCLCVPLPQRRVFSQKKKKENVVRRHFTILLISLW